MSPQRRPPAERRITSTSNPAITMRWESIRARHGVHRAQTRNTGELHWRPRRRPRRRSTSRASAVVRERRKRVDLLASERGRRPHSPGRCRAAVGFGAARPAPGAPRATNPTRAKIRHSGRRRLRRRAAARTVVVSISPSWCGVVCCADYGRSVVIVELPDQACVRSAGHGQTRRWGRWGWGGQRRRRVARCGWTSGCSAISRYRLRTTSSR